MCELRGPLYLGMPVQSSPFAVPRRCAISMRPPPFLGSIGLVYVVPAVFVCVGVLVRAAWCGAPQPTLCRRLCLSGTLPREASDPRLRRHKSKRSHVRLRNRLPNSLSDGSVIKAHANANANANEAASEPAGDAAPAGKASRKAMVRDAQQAEQSGAPATFAEAARRKQSVNFLDRPGGEGEDVEEWDSDFLSQRAGGPLSFAPRPRRPPSRLLPNAPD